jgi:hypothetical protein
MRNFRFDTGFITGFDAGNNRTGNYFINLLLGNRQLLSNLIAHAQINLYTSSAESLSLLRAVPRRNTRGLCSQGIFIYISLSIYTEAKDILTYRFFEIFLITAKR